MKRRRICRVILPALLAAAGVAAFARQERGLQIKIQSSLVLVDMIATDAEGRFVADLRPEEIRLSEDGRRCEITSFELRDLGPDPTAAETSRGNEPGRAPGITLAFLLDLNSIGPTHLPQVKEAVSGFVRSRMRPQDRLMLAAGTSRSVIVQPPTGDLAAFLEALERIEATGEPAGRLLRFGEELEILVLQMKSADLDPQMVCRNATSFGRQFIMEEEEQVRSACSALTEFVKEVGGLPGRKSVLFYSGGYRPKIGLVIQEILIRYFGGIALGHGDTTTLQIKSMLGALESATRMESYLQKMIEEANRARVSFYAVDARALVAHDEGRFRRTGPLAEELWREETSQPQNLLRDLASQTGGRWFFNSNDLALGIDGVYRDSARYYELGYVPAGKPAPGRRHRIELAVARPGVHLRYRESYFEPEPYDAERRALENAFKFPGLFADFPVAAEVTRQGPNWKIEVLVPADRVRLVRAGERYRCDLSVYMALFDEAGNLYGGKPLSSKTYRLDFSAAQAADLGRFKNVTSTFQGRIAPGKYRLRVVVRQLPAAGTAALEKRITIE